MDIIFQYPPDLMHLLIDAIPRLCRSKRDVLLFFKGAGVSSTLTNDLEIQLKKDRNNISKYEIVRTVLTRLNEKGESTLRERREILKCITEFEKFSTCYPEDHLAAKGLVAEIRELVNVKDSFTRMKIEHEAEQKQRLVEQQAKIEKEQRRKTKLAAVKSDLYALFNEGNCQKRGKALESILNRLFEANGILIREAFTINGSQREGIVEQIDGAVEIKGAIYLVEMKWWHEPLGPLEVSQHLVRIHSRGQARGIIISESGYTGPAITICKDALRDTVIVLCKLKEIVMLLEHEKDLKAFFDAKINAAIIDKNPMAEINPMEL
ncbi:MAG: restriction endonuclease [Methanothrix sp.]|nr:restriction endonuclease [Methanothrix sp.]